MFCDLPKATQQVGLKPRSSDSKSSGFSFAIHRSLKMRTEGRDETIIFEIVKGEG